MEKFNEYDNSKLMLETLRRLKKMSLIENVDNKDIVLLNDGVEVNKDKSLMDFWVKDKSSFMETVTPNVTFKTFIITPKGAQIGGNVKMVGEFDNGISFDMNKSEQLGLVINANNVKLDNDTYLVLTSLYKYYDVWSNEWATKLNTENFGNLLLNIKKIKPQ